MRFAMRACFGVGGAQGKLYHYIGGARASACSSGPGAHPCDGRSIPLFLTRFVLPFAICLFRTARETDPEAAHGARVARGVVKRMRDVGFTGVAIDTCALPHPTPARRSAAHKRNGRKNNAHFSLHFPAFAPHCAVPPPRLAATRTASWRRSSTCAPRAPGPRRQAGARPAAVPVAAVAPLREDTA
jgi:hypothetical protein